MKRFWTVFKAQLNVNFGFSALLYRFRKEKEKIPQTILMGVGVTAAAGFLVCLYSLLMGSIYVAGAAMGSPELVLVTALLGLQMFLLITGIFYVIGVFFYSKDLGALLPLPLAPWQVLGAKFAVVMAYEYLMAVPILLPPMLLYGAGQSAGPVYCMKALLILIVSPAIPLLIASLVAIVLMRILNIGRRKDLLAIVGGSLVTIAILAFNLLTQRFAQNAAAPDVFTKLLSDQMQVIDSISAAFPPSAWAALALSQTGAASAFYLALYVAVSALLLAAMLWLAGKLYYRTAMASDETGKRSRRAGSGKPPREGFVTAGPVRAIVLKEYKLLLRTPAYAMNCLIGSLIIPVVIPLSMTQGEETTAGLLRIIQNPANSLAVTFAAACVMLFASLINVTASTALSREGKTFWVSRMIPVEPARQVYAKFLTAMGVSCAGLLLAAIMLVVFLKLNIYQCVLALAFGFLGTIPVTVVNMLPDIIKPKLTWTNPYEAVKQNLNVMTSMLAAAILMGFIVVCVLLLIFTRMPDWAVYLAVTALLVALSAASVKVLSLAARRYDRHESL